MYEHKRTCNCVGSWLSNTGYRLNTLCTVNASMGVHKVHYEL